MTGDLRSIPEQNDFKITNIRFSAMLIVESNSTVFLKNLGGLFKYGIDKKSEYFMDISLMNHNRERT